MSAIDACLFVLCGEAGVGKTAVGEHIRDCANGRLIRTDIVRQDLFSNPQYTATESEQVYQEVFERASDVLNRGDDVVLDGTFREEADRGRAVQLAEECGAEWQLIRVTCEKAVVEERLQARGEDAASDADFAVHVRHRETFEPLSRPHETVDNSNERSVTRQQVVEIVGGE